MKATVLKIVIAILAACGVLGFMGWRSLQPKIGKATEAEIRAVTPAVLLISTPTDAAAQDRYKRLMVLLKGINTKPYEAILNPNKKSPSEIEADGSKFLAKEEANLRKIGTILAEGPIQCTTKKASDTFPGLSEAKGVIKCIAGAGIGLADSGNYKGATDQFVLGAKLADAMMRSKGVLIDYLVGVSMTAVIDRQIQNALILPGFPASQCQRLLKAMPAASAKDDLLKTATISDYQQFTVPLLTDPKQVLEEMRGMTGSDSSDQDKKADVYGTFDPVPTANMIGRVYAEEVANCDRPLSSFTDVEAERADQAAKGLPKPPREDGNGWDKFRYRFQMNNGQNTIGLTLATSTVTGKNLITASCRWRAFRDALRVHCAAIIYRSSHGGSMPTTSAGFAPILGGWPMDPYNGSPMLYNRYKSVAYAVGENLVDDQGDLSSSTFNNGPDIGASLGH